MTENGKDQHQLSVLDALERCLSKREFSYSKMTENGKDQHQLSVLDALERCLSKREFSYSKTGKRQG